MIAGLLAAAVDRLLEDEACLEERFLDGSSEADYRSTLAFLQSEAASYPD